MVIWSPSASRAASTWSTPIATVKLSWLVSTGSQREIDPGIREVLTDQGCLPGLVPHARHDEWDFRERQAGILEGCPRPGLIRGDKGGRARLADRHAIDEDIDAPVSEGGGDPREATRTIAGLDEEANHHALPSLYSWTPYSGVQA